jgi:hypothetical protein
MKSESRHEELRQQCMDFHAANPKVWELFVKFTFEKIRKKFDHYSCRGVFHRIRWETDQVPTEGEDVFKLNNNHSPFYARRFMKMYPVYEGFFRVRRQISKGEEATHLPPLTPEYFDT